MDHPFISDTELSEHQILSVSGGKAYSPSNISPKVLGPTPVKPAIGSTMAIGEEGGSFGDWF